MFDLPDIRDRLWPRSQPQPTHGLVGHHRPRATSRALDAIEQRTAVRVAGVVAEAVVQAAKARELDHVGRGAATGQVMFRRWNDALAAGDPFLFDETKPFLDLARIGKLDFMADLIETYCRESRW